MIARSPSQSPVRPNGRNFCWTWRHQILFMSIWSSRTRNKKQRGPHPRMAGQYSGRQSSRSRVHPATWAWPRHLQPWSKSRRCDRPGKLVQHMPHRNARRFQYVATISSGAHEVIVCRTNEHHVHGVKSSIRTCDGPITWWLLQLKSSETMPESGLPSCSYTSHRNFLLDTSMIYLGPCDFHSPWPA